MLRDNDQRVGGEAHDDGRNSVEDVGGEADGIGELSAAPELSQENPPANADGNANEAGQSEKGDRTDDGIGHSAACLTDGRGNFGEEVHIQRAGAFDDEIDEDCRERHNHQDRRQHRKRCCRLVGQPAEARPKLVFLRHFLSDPLFSNCRSSFSLSTLRCGGPARDRPDEQAGDCVHNDGDDEQRQTDFDERAQVHVADGLGKFVGDD